MHICSLTALEAGGWKWRCHKAPTSFEAAREALSCPFQLLVAPGVSGHVAATLQSLCPPTASLCVCV